jgi:hypothetical protein
LVVESVPEQHGGSAEFTGDLVDRRITSLTRSGFGAARSAHLDSTHDDRIEVKGSSLGCRTLSYLARAFL